MPAVNFPERSGDERRCDDAAIDKQIINLKRIRAPVITCCIQRADLAGEGSLETTNAGEQTEEREEERYVEGHQKMPGCHEQRADRDCAGASEHTVGDQSAADRREINETSVEAENRRGQGLDRERAAINALEQVAKWTEPGDALDVSGVQQPVDHVEHEQRLHAIIGKAFPSFGEGEIAKTARMTDEAAILGVVHDRRLLRPNSFSKRSPCRILVRRVALTRLRLRDADR